MERGWPVVYPAGSADGLFAGSLATGMSVLAAATKSGGAAVGKHRGVRRNENRETLTIPDQIAYAERQQKEAKETVNYPFKNISPLALKLMLESAGRSPDMAGAIALTKTVQKDLFEWVRSYERHYSNARLGFDEFRQHWLWYRLVIPLQVRLMVEQILWLKGEPWRSLVSGFKPI